MTLSLGEALEGKYEILDKIGEGGMGSVYKVRHRLLEEIRVIKVLRAHAAEMEDLQRRFLREARMAIKLKHPNIAQLHDFSIAADGTAYIVMEFIDGIGLDGMIKTSEPPSVDLSIELSTQALAALHYLHEHQFVHRDVSPDNLMLTSNFDGSPLIKLIDLGIAKNLDAEAQLTQTGVFLGKVRYCSPEQFSGKQGEDQVLDRGSDLYSFGVLFYELLTGVYPFNGESFAELAGSHLFQPPKDFSETDPDGKIPQELRDIVLKALEKDRADRFETAEEFSTAISVFRNPDIVLKDEFDRTVEITTTALPKLGTYDKPGSTQGRLNREFGLETTPGPRKLAAGESQAGKQAAGTASIRGSKIVWIAAIAATLALITAGVVFWRTSTKTTPAGDGETVQVANDSAALLATQFEATQQWTTAGPGSSDFEPEVLEAVALPDGELEGEQTDSEVEAPQSEPPPPRDEGPQEPVIAETPPPAESTPPAVQAPATPVVGSSELFQPGVGVIRPVLLELPEPVVPSDVRALKEDAVYIVRVLVDEHGKVLTALVDSGPNFKRRLREAAPEAAKKAVFQAASRDGMTGRMWTEVRIVYKAQ